MKFRSQYILVLAVVCAGVACEKDNYDPPKSTLSGRIVYQGEAIGVETNQVPFELYQFGFGKVGGINSSIAQDGTYSALLFDGDYKLIIPNGQGPFIWKQTPGGAPDSIAITINGNQTLDIDVTPFYMIRNAQFAKVDTSVQATFKVEKIVTDSLNGKNIERVSLYVNKTQFVSGNGDEKISNVDLSGADITDPNNIQIKVVVPKIVPTQNYVFARVGVKIEGVEDMIYSAVQKVDL